MIYLLRHGEAEPGDGGDDAARPLTEKGKRQAQDAGRALALLGAAIDACLTSPKLRAIETARLACEPLGIEPEVEPALESGPFDPLGIAAGRGETMLVGHEPAFSTAVAGLTGGRVKLRKGGLAVVDGSTLVALLRPAELATIAASPGGSNRP